MQPSSPPSSTSESTESSAPSLPPIPASPIEAVRAQTAFPWFVPHKPWPKQLAFLLLPHLEAFYGGAAGPGKSDALLMGGLQYAEHPNYRAMLFRQSYADLCLPGALMDRAWDWLKGTGAKWDNETHTYFFHTGASLGFGYCENEGDEDRYQGMEVDYIGIDELTQWREKQYRYLFSRIRRLVGSTIPPRMRSASNPGGKGHDWVKARFIVDANTVEGRATIRALLSDNPSLDRVSYLKSLAHLEPVTRERLERGDWEARESGGVFKREWFGIAAGFPPEWCHRIRYWDMAATQGGGDWTPGVRMAIDPAGRFVIEHVVRGQWAPGSRDVVIAQTADSDPAGTVVGWEEEGGSAGKSVTVDLGRKLRRFSLFADHKTGQKVVRWGPLASQAELGNVLIVPGSWNEAFLDEMTVVKGDDKEETDDQADAAAGAYHYLTRFGPYQDPPSPQGDEPEGDDGDDEGPTIGGSRVAWRPIGQP